MAKYPVDGGGSKNVIQRPFVPVQNTHESYIMSAAVLELSIPNGVREIIMQAVSQNIRYTLDGTDPTTARGFQMVAGDPERRVSISSQTRLKFLREANGAVLQYQFGE